MKLPFFGRSGAAPSTPGGEADRAGAASDARPLGRSGRAVRAVLYVLLLVLVVATVAVFVQVARQAESDGKLLSVIDGLQLLSQTVAKEGSEASKGREVSFDRLQQAADDFDKSLNLLANGDPLAPMPALPPDEGLTVAAAELVQRWEPVRENVSRMVAARPAVLAVQAGAQRFDATKPRLLGVIEDFTRVLEEDQADARQVAVAGQLLMLVERLSESLQRTLAGGEQAAIAADRFQRDSVYMRHLIDGFEKGEYVFGVSAVTSPAARSTLASLSEAYAETETLIEEIYGQSFQLLDIQDAAAEVIGQTESVAVHVRSLRDSYQSYAASRPASIPLGAVLGGLAVLMLMLIGLHATTSARREAQGERESAVGARVREEQIREINQRNQEAILRLLDEISDLADGDLTANATVTEEITGAIADAINYAIDALREIVININAVSVAVAGEARDTRDTALRLTEASEAQANQIASVANSIQQLAGAAQTVAANAERSRSVAEQAVQYANDGNEAVRATIDGMDNIRETIQETSKRIKRLGESSQEIGEIVGLIDDIADQTNILALNAAIQASMAGEQGRGFAVVADEVQRLAERASQATKQIEALVKAIQSDTNEAVNSMEQSTAGVVQGADLAEDAGQALVRIEVVSNELAGLVTSISESASGQTTQASAANESMNEISRITDETTSGTQETARSVGRLAQLAADLRTSVAGFRLPESGGAAVGDVVGLRPEPDDEDTAKNQGETPADAVEDTPRAQAGA